MTDLPFGRGEIPLHILIVRGINQTQISDIKVSKGVDTGPIYMKRSLDFSSGNLDEILHRVSSIVFQEMIYEFLRGSVSCQEQTGEAVIFKRRHPSQSEIPAGLLHRQIYDYIRMLDGEECPTAYVKAGRENIFFATQFIKMEMSPHSLYGRRRRDESAEGCSCSSG